MKEEQIYTLLLHYFYSCRVMKFLDMLEEDKEFRYSVAGAIGYKEILDKFADLETRMDERFDKRGDKGSKQ